MSVDAKVSLKVASWEKYLADLWVVLLVSGKVAKMAE